MQKGIRLFKRMVALSLVLLLSIESFAAVVSDNDGSAFITKAEIDSLKNSFQSQINQYSTSMDSKIDGAIASYLAGIKVVLNKRTNVFFQDWNEITMRNYELKNQYGYPTVNLQMSYFGAGHNATNFDRYPSAYGLGTVLNGNGVISHMKAVSLLSGSEQFYNDTTKNKFCWLGYINDYNQVIAGSKLAYNNNQDVAGAYWNIDMQCYDIVRFNSIANQFYTNAEKENFWNTKWGIQLRGQWDYIDSTHTTPFE